MTHQEIITQLSQISPQDALHSFTSESVLKAIVQRLGPDALYLTPEDIQLAMEEVKAAIEHHLDERDYIDMGLDAWELSREIQS
ncbi:hypothetical protein Despr_1023 [Desulfobulbus propionicus DSM 2032]|uniref:Uncharacterized protein n=1 Tax=Desulfobulbus propionicus (strain ATCC 33891 / DSM 2032 / VKM B-1956 / 1pr3) TaxID=577650 RepID=A0A7U3YKU0_DESPD|nr:hypothetical protein [Desulfobulbus propionicus]ADW17195.1 hypothetical protein Despr_1023 [Desulfobulbus propionicus DSM 2032]